MKTDYNFLKSARWCNTFVVTLVMLFGSFAFAQGPASNYTFSEGTETYAQITGTTSTATGDDGTQTNVSIGFTFTLGLTGYTSVGITTNGMIRLGSNATNTAIASGWVNSLGNTAVLRPLIAPFWGDNNLSTGTIRYSTTGTAPNRVFTVNWHNTKVGSTGGTGGASVSSLVRLYETTNVIEFVYGSPYTTTNTVTASVGINDSSSFLSVTPAATSTVSSATANNAINATVMANLAGKKLTFTPPVVLTPPNCASALVPANLATGVIRNPTLSWTAATGSPTSYDVYLGTSAGAPLVGNVAGTSYTPSILAANTQYFWKVVPKNANGSAVGCVEQSFTTGTSIVYCAPTYASGCSGDNLVSITLNTLSDSGMTCVPVVEDRSGVQNAIPNLVQANNETVTLTLGTDGNQYNAIWIDFNQNGIFDTSEYFSTETNALGNGVQAITIAVPAGATLGNTKMRVRAGSDVQSTSAMACGAAASPWGSSRDYTVNIVAPSNDTMDYNNIQWITDFNTGSNTTYSSLAGTPLTVYAQGYEAGVTEAAGQGAGVQAWIGYNATNTDPSTWTTWIPATYFTNVFNNDEFNTVLNLPTGTYYIASRWKLNTGPFTYGGNAGTWDGTGSNSIELTVDPNPTQCATLDFPADGATNVPAGALTLAWTAPTSGPAPTGYKVYSGLTSGSLTLLTTTTNTTLNVNVPSYNTTYFWQVVPTSVIGGGDAVGCVEFSFTTGADPFLPYCSGMTFTSNVEPISSVNFAGINNTSPAGLNAGPAHENFIAITGAVTAGSSYPMILKGNTDGAFTNNFRVFIDWNQDGDFVDAGELYNAGTIFGSTGLDAVQASSTIAVPANATPGTTRMRVKKIFSTTNIDNPCLGTGFGQFEDYSLAVSVTWYADSDGDTYGDPNSTIIAPANPGGYVLNNTDCNDNNATVNPGATEVCYDGLDNNCDGTIDEGCTPIVSVVQPSQCGVTLATINQNIYANLVAGAQGYRFTVTDMTTNQVQSIDKALRVFQLTQLANYAFARTYQVEVSIRFNNVWQPFVGSACLVTTPSAVTQVQAAQCDGQLTTMADVIYANNVPFASGYKFRITNLLTSASVEVERLTRDVRLNNIALFTPEFNTTYSVEVAVKNTNGTYLPYNPVVCNVTTPSFPTTQLQLSQCDVTISNPNTTIYADSYVGATTYRFRFVDGAFTYTFDRPLRSFILSSIPVPAGATYSVQVSIEINGVFGPYGKICTLTIPGSARGNDAVAGNDFQAIASPNPFASTFGLNLSTTSEEAVQVRVYDMLGKLVEDRKAQASDIIELGDNYPSGVYNVIVSQGENTKTMRVIKR